jgi:hypothetical protein
MAAHLRTPRSELQEIFLGMKKQCTVHLPSVETGPRKLKLSDAPDARSRFFADRRFRLGVDKNDFDSRTQISEGCRFFRINRCAALLARIASDILVYKRTLDFLGNSDLPRR